MRDYNIKFEIGDLVDFYKETNPDDAKFNPWKVKRILIHDDNLVSYDLISDRNLATTGAYGDVLKIHVKEEDFKEKVSFLEKQLAEANDEINWWKKKYAEDCQEMRLVKIHL